MVGRGVRWGVLCIFAVALIAAGTGEATSSDASDLDEAARLLQAGRLFPAEQAARRAVASAPASAPAHHLLGRILVRRQHFDEAERALARAAELDPERPGLDRELGFVRFELGRHAEARAALTRAVERDPDDAEAWLRLGLCERALGDREAAAAAFERAARHPAVQAVALYNLGVVSEELGRGRDARRAFERALSSSLPQSVAERATARLASLPPGERPWSLSAAAGLAYESKVVRVEVDRVDDSGDGSAQLELGGGYETDLGRGVGLDVGYDFFQSLYFHKTEFDFQSHAFRGAFSKEVAAVDTALGYVYSLNTLDGARFLDFHEVRASGGGVVTDWWYTSVTPAYRAKRFDDPTDRARDADTFEIGLLQLFPVGDGWRRYALVGLDLEREDTEGAQFDYRGLRFQMALHLPVNVFEREVPIDVRYRFWRRDYLNPGGADDGGKRDDRIHDVRGRIEVPLAGPVSLIAEYQYEDYGSNLSSVDRDVHEVGVHFRASL
jgi:tetratricopeptide (TPR) repeat protein